LQEFAGRFAPMPKDRAQVAKCLRFTGHGRGEIVARDRDGEVGPQAQLMACGIGEQIHVPPHVLAGEVEKRLGRLQDRR